MTTRIHVVNFGPDKVVVDKTQVEKDTGKLVLIGLPEYLYPMQYADFLVYDTQEIHITEVKNG